MAKLEVLHAPRAGSEDYQRVERWLDTEIQKSPRSVPLQIYLADLRNLQGRYQDAESIYRQVIIGRDNPSPVALNNLAWLLATRDNRGTEARPLIDRAVQQLGEIPELLDTRSVVYLAMGSSDLAVKDLENAIASTVPDAKLRSTLSFHLARAYQKAGNRGKAAAALRNAKDSGFEADKLHPLERAAYQQLLSDLGIEENTTRAARGP